MSYIETVTEAQEVYDPSVAVHEAFLQRIGMTEAQWQEHCKRLIATLWNPTLREQVIDPIERDLNDKTWDERDIDAQEEYETERGN
jgi:hypothetical protein